MNHSTQDYFVHAVENGISTDELFFVPAKIFSPYMECASDVLNVLQESENKTIEVNPLYRFDKLFSTILSSEYEGVCEKLKEVIFDKWIHIVHELDRVKDMPTKAYVYEQLNMEITKGLFGKEISDGWNEFDEMEKESILFHIIHLQYTYDNIKVFRSVITTLFPECFLFSLENNKLLLYMNENENRIKTNKIRYLERMFLSIGQGCEIYWDKPFGVFEVDESIIMDEFELI